MGSKTQGGGGGTIIPLDPETGDNRNDNLGGNNWKTNEYLIYADLNKTFDALYNYIGGTS